MKAERQQYKGHVIELRKRDDSAELVIDNTVVRYGVLPGGLYFLRDYAYDWSNNLVDLAKKFLDYQRNIEIRNNRESHKRS